MQLKADFPYRGSRGTRSAAATPICVTAPNTHTSSPPHSIQEIQESCPVALLLKAAWVMDTTCVVVQKKSLRSTPEHLRSHDSSPMAVEA
ncbi:hypothetical protein L13192_01562 [Pyrenophora tritici-repentis]|nr:hypothetical protein Ptr86124_001204 [Pyrenophora tritici-repentis]KAI1674815.1 hypothetical protein L13192_01562 [Pyrenophora tritici-repentis]